jgi:lytic murein transglycosylase
MQTPPRRKPVRRFPAVLALAVLLLLPAGAASADFRGFVAALWPDARAAGVSRATFDAAFAGVTPDPSVIAETKKQAEFVKPIWSYLDSAISGGRLARGRAAAEEWSSTLASAERQYGVPARIVLGIWGMETSYGGFTGNQYVIRSLASLAYARYRGTFFRDELIQALRILEEGHLSEPRAMKGSWAGAMGQTQFMPSSFVKYAIDFNGDGRKDIWSNRQDAIGSTANYLKQFGWVSGMPWGVEVTLPQGFDYRLADRTRMRQFSEWAGLGVTRADGEAMPRGEAALFLPAGARGPKFLITPNFAVIRKYNNSDAYALAVAHLGDRIYGADPFEAAWPRGEKQLSMAQAKDLQRRLAALGYPMEKIDGKLGEKSREQIRAFQLRTGLLPDGHPTPAVLARVKEAGGVGATGSTRPRRE